MLFKVLLQLPSIKTSLILKVNILPYEGKVLFLFLVVTVLKPDTYKGPVLWQSPTFPLGTQGSSIKKQQ